MKASDEFFAGTRYAIFGARAHGRSQGKVAIDALRKAGKTPIAIEPNGATVEKAEVKTSLADAGQVDGAILLPPAPWDQSADRFMAEAIKQCKDSNTPMWVYTAGGDGIAKKALDSAGADAVIGKCPCLYIVGGGFPHNFHRWIEKVTGKL